MSFTRQPTVIKVHVPPDSNHIRVRLNGSPAFKPDVDPDKPEVMTDEEMLAILNGEIEAEESETRDDGEIMTDEEMLAILNGDTNDEQTEGEESKDGD